MARKTARCRNLFAYGTLREDSLVEKITGKRFRNFTARLEGYAVVPYLSYCGLKRDRDKSVEGKMLRDVDEHSLHRIDEYEGDLYRRIKLKVKLKHRETVAYTYVPKYRVPKSALEDRTRNSERVS